jgi:endonuclease III
MTTPNPIRGPDAPNRFEEILTLAGIGFLLASLLLPWWLGIASIVVAGVSYTARYVKRHGL